MDLQYFKLTVEKGVATALLNRPEKGNSMSPDVLREIGDLFIHLDTRLDVSVIILTGGEKIFSAGFDLDFVKEIKRESNEAFVALFHRAYRSIRFCGQPVLAAIGGPAMAGGFDLTQMCDIRYASERARFGQREIVLALNPTMDPLWRIIGLSNAMESALTGRIWDAQEALRMGYVSRIFPEDKLLEEVGVIAREMATYDRGCLKETKQLTHMLLGSDLDQAMRQQE